MLIIEPAQELVFHGPFTQAVSSVMKLTNPSSKKVCFKIKTTAPKRYCVKPNSGVIDPDQTVEIAVTLQPFEFDPQEKNRHKFMVQSMYAPDGEINQDTLWKEADGSNLMDSKLRCVFLLPDENSQSGSQSLAPTTTQGLVSGSVSPKIPGSGAAMEADNIRKAMEEVKRLQEELSSLRQENLQLKEETLRQSRINAQAGGGADDGSSPGFSSIKVTASAPDQNALTTTYLYVALILLVLGIIIGKWFL